MFLAKIVKLKHDSDGVKFAKFGEMDDWDIFEFLAVRKMIKLSEGIEVSARVLLEDGRPTKAILDQDITLEKLDGTLINNVHYLKFNKAGEIISYVQN
jgi:hypothetical protein